MRTKTQVMAVGAVERAVRSSVAVGEVLSTPTGRGQFRVAEYRFDSLVLLLGAKEAGLPCHGRPWRACLISCEDVSG